jgi:two-component system, OmpR family, response regulator
MGGADSAGTTAEGKVRILVVDDEVKLVRALRRGLEREGHAVDVAVTAAEALYRACETDYDVILLDVMLPRAGTADGAPAGTFSGVEVCRTLRDRGRWVPILMLTARDTVGDRVRGLDAGADDYLIKPFAFAELLARLRALVRRGAPERPVRLRVDDVELDPAARTVTREGRPVDLSPKEFALLEYLMRHPGEVVNRRRILENVWDYDYDGLSNVVDVYVGYLRRKLERPFGRPLIRTARGVGYGVG